LSIKTRVSSECKNLYKKPSSNKIKSEFNGYLLGLTKYFTSFLTQNNVSLRQQNDNNQSNSDKLEYILLWFIKK